MKNHLSVLKQPPPVEFLEALKLTKIEYRQLRRSATEKRDKESFDLRVVPGADRIVQQALEMLCTYDIRGLWCGVVVCSGLRPADIMTVKLSKPESKHKHDGWWLCVTNYSKKGKNVKNEIHRDLKRDKPLLCPAWLFTRAIDKIRAYFKMGTMTKRDAHKRWAKTWLSFLSKGYPQLIKPTHVTFRRFYALYAYMYFKDDFTNSVSQNAFVSWSLGHSCNDLSLTNSNLELRNAGDIDLFTIGANLQLKPQQSTSSRKKTKKHSTPKTTTTPSHAALITSPGVTTPASHSVEATHVIKHQPPPVQLSHSVEATHVMKQPPLSSQLSHSVEATRVMKPQPHLPVQLPSTPAGSSKSFISSHMSQLSLSNDSNRKENTAIKHTTGQTKQASTSAAHADSTKHTKLRKSTATHSSKSSNHTSTAPLNIVDRVV